jgi:hypothetical protein
MGTTREVVDNMDKQFPPSGTANTAQRQTPSEISSEINNMLADATKQKHLLNRQFNFHL